MAFKLVGGRAVTEHYTAAGSTAFTNGALTYWNGSGAIIPADATSGQHAGIITKTIASTDSDYTSTKVVEVIVPQDDNIFEVDVSTGTFTTSMIGNTYDLASSTGIDVSAQSKNVVTIVGYKSATIALVKINAVVANKDVATT